MSNGVDEPAIQGRDRSLGNVVAKPKARGSWKKGYGGAAQATGGISTYGIPPENIIVRKGPGGSTSCGASIKEHRADARFWWRVRL